MSDAQLFEERFTITNVNTGNYDRIARLTADRHGTQQETMTMKLDVNSDLFTITEGDQMSVMLATSLNLDGSKEESDQSWRPQQGPSLADNWEYVMHGKIFDFSEAEDGEEISVQASFGGLLLFLTGPFKKLTPLRIDHIYILLKR